MKEAWQHQGSCAKIPQGPKGDGSVRPLCADNVEKLGIAGA
jgi:hypothetical protein